MVGIPPLSGFWPKIYLFQAGFAQGAYVLTGAVAAASFLTMYLIARLWAEVFWKEMPPGGPAHQDLYNRMNAYGKALLVAPVVLLVFVRFLRGPGIVNRVVALDLLITTGIAIIAVYSIITNQSTFLDIAMILALIAFLGTVAFSYYLQRKQKNG
jgi:multicomponent Na+:H+ antiporter subunit F